MTNYEFYKEKIEEIEKKCTVALVNNKPVHCEGLHCEECQRHIYESLGLVNCSVVKFMEWANEEHEEPKINLPKDIEVDTPILVSNDDKLWCKRYFAGFEDEKVLAFAHGTTSWTAGSLNATIDWNYAKLPEEGQKNE